MARFTQIDYDREMAFIATAADEHGRPEILGVVRAIAEADHARAEFAIVVRSDLKALGLGHVLMDKMIRYCRQRGVKGLVGQVLPDNQPMLHFAQSFGFACRQLPSGDAVEVNLAL